MKSADWTASITRRELLRRLGAVGLTTAGTAAGLTLLAGCQPSPPAPCLGNSMDLPARRRTRRGQRRRRLPIL